MKTDMNKIVQRIEREAGISSLVSTPAAQQALTITDD